MGRPGLTRHRKFGRLARALDAMQLGFGEVLARGTLELLWDAAYESGDPLLGDADDVEGAAHWRGPKGLLCEALLAAGGDGHAGFIEEVSGRPGQYQVHDLFDHAPEYVASRRVQEQERRKPKRCLECGSEFRSRDPRATYCRPACRTAAWRHRETDGDGEVRHGDGEVRHGDGRETDCDAPPAPAPAQAPAPAPAHERGAAPRRNLAAGLPNRDEHLAAAHPRSQELLDALAAEGIPMAHASKRADRVAVEQLLAGVDLASAVDAVRASFRATPKGWIGWHRDAIAALASGSTRVGDLGATHGDEWWRNLPRGDLEAFLEERERIDPELRREAPMQATGVRNVPAVESLIEHARRRAQEARQGAAR